MSPALTEKFEIFIYSQKNSNPVDVPHVYPLATATERISLDPEVFNEDIEDPVDFIIMQSLGNGGLYLRKSPDSGGRTYCVCPRSPRCLKTVLTHLLRPRSCFFLYTGARFMELFE